MTQSTQYLLVDALRCVCVLAAEVQEVVSAYHDSGDHCNYNPEQALSWQ